MYKNFTCLNCEVVFDSVDTHRAHFKSNWHRFNLQRQMEALPIVSNEAFKLREQQLHKPIEENPTQHYCNVCHKLFGNAKALSNHLNSKKHIYNLKRAHAQHKFAASKLPSAAQNMQSIPEAENDCVNVDFECRVIAVHSTDCELMPKLRLTDKDCLFCIHNSLDMIENLKHMSITHSFFLPDAEYCIDLKGLLCYLGEKVAINYMCLWCNERGKVFHSLDAVRKHMHDKGHCQLANDNLTLLEYAIYYDNSKRYMNVEDNKITHGSGQLRDSIDIIAHELVLPTGATVGNRSLLRYYKQHLNPRRAMVTK